MRTGTGIDSDRGRVRGSQHMPGSSLDHHPHAHPIHKSAVDSSISSGVTSALGGIFSLGTGFSSLTALLGAALPQENVLPHVRRELQHITAIIKYHAVRSHFEQILHKEHPQSTLGIEDLSSCIPLLLPRIGPLGRLLTDTQELLGYDGDLLMSRKFRKHARDQQRAQGLIVQQPTRVLLAKDSSKHLLRLWLCAQRLHEMLEAVVDEKWGLDLTFARLSDLITSNILYSTIPNCRGDLQDLDLDNIDIDIDMDIDINDSGKHTSTAKNGPIKGIDLGGVRASTITDDILSRFLSSLRQQEAHIQQFELHKEIKQFYKVRQMLPESSIRKSIIATAFVPADYYEMEESGADVDGTVDCSELPQENWESKAQIQDFKTTSTATDMSAASNSSFKTDNKMSNRRKSVAGRRVSVNQGYQGTDNDDNNNNNSSSSSNNNNVDNQGQQRSSGGRRRSLADIKNNVNHLPSSSAAGGGRRRSISEKAAAFLFSEQNSSSFIMPQSMNMNNNNNNNTSSTGRNTYGRNSSLSGNTNININDNGGNGPNHGSQLPKNKKANRARRGSLLGPNLGSSASAMATNTNTVYTGNTDANTATDANTDGTNGGHGHRAISGRRRSVLALENFTTPDLQSLALALDSTTISNSSTSTSTGTGIDISRVNEDTDDDDEGGGGGDGDSKKASLLPLTSTLSGSISIATNKPFSSAYSSSAFNRENITSHPASEEDLFSFPAPSPSTQNQFQSQNQGKLNETRNVQVQNSSAPRGHGFSRSRGNTDTDTDTGTTTVKGIGIGQGQDSVVAILCRTNYSTFPANVRAWFELARDCFIDKVTRLRLQVSQSDVLYIALYCSILVYW